MLVEKTLFETRNKVDDAIERLKYFEPGEGYYLAFSGGKDSVVIKELANMAGVKYDAHYNVTTIDPPELVWFIKRQHKDVIFDMPEMPFLQKLSQVGFPQRHRRWCCSLYKENGGKDRRVITGVRRAESGGRRHRPVFHHCYSGGYKSKNKTIVNPIVDFTDSDVWQFIKERELPYCELYDIGWKRVGCLFCPMGGKMRAIQAERYPKWVKLFIKYFQRLHDTGRDSMKRWKDGEEMFWWWLNEDKGSESKDQLFLFD